MLTLVIVLTPLCLYRWVLARVYDADVELIDMSGGELQFWLPVGLVAAVVIRWAPQRAKFPLQALFHNRSRHRTPESRTPNPEPRTPNPEETTPHGQCGLQIE